MLLESQSRPSYKPSPEVAQVLWMYLKDENKKFHASNHAGVDSLYKMACDKYEGEIKYHNCFKKKKMQIDKHVINDQCIHEAYYNKLKKLKKTI